MALHQGKPSIVTAPIIAASMFKNGYAMILREFSVPGPGVYELDSLPISSLGTLWFSSTSGPVIDSVKAVDVQSFGIQSLQSIDEILRANIGKKVRLGMKNGDQVTGSSQVGELIGAQGDVVILDTGKGQLVIPKSSVSSISGEGGKLKFETPTTIMKRALKIDSRGTAGKIQFISLEKGLSWAPSFALDISDGKSVKLTAKATVLNNLADLDGVATKFITGFRHIPYADQVDPLVEGGQQVRVVTQNLGVGMSIPQNRSEGGQGLVPRGVDFMSADPELIALMSKEAPGQQLEDLFVYNRPQLSLKSGERADIVLFSMEAPYEDVYTWDIFDAIENNVDYHPVPEGPGDVWHGISFQNTSHQPFSSGVATTLKRGEIIGQDSMNYVSPKGRAELRITKALDISAEALEEETSRQRGAVKYLNGNAKYDIVTITGTLEMANSKPDAVILRVRKDFTGEFLSGDGSPEVKSTTKGLLQANPAGRLNWNVKLGSGERRLITYKYKLYVRSGQ